MDRRTVELVADPYPPYQFEDGGRIKGIDQETIREAFAVHEIQVGTVLLPWGECLQRMAERKADGIFQIARSPERQEFYLFSELLRTERTVLFARKGSQVRLQNGSVLREQLEGRTVGVLDGYSYNAEIEHLPEPVKVRVPNQETLLRALASGRVDLILMDNGVAAYLAGRLGVEGMEQVGYAIARELHVAFQKQHRDLANLFNAGLREIRARKIDRRICENYHVTL
jgi:polar amino acid transport system substrate-binding protein